MMMAMAQGPDDRRNWWRVARWGAAAGLLGVPAVAVRVPGSGFEWTASDFVVMGALFAAVLGGYEMLASRASSTAYRAGAVLSALGVFLLVWINLAVGIIGHEGNAANWMFAGVIAIIVGGACVARFEGRRMSRALFIAAGAQLLIGIVALGFGLGVEGRGWPRDVIVLSAFFSSVWAVAGALFRVAGDR